MSLFKRLYDIARAEMNFRQRNPVEDRRDTDWGAEPEPENSERERPRAADDPIAHAYAVLELDAGADLETVERAWKKLLRQYHPDKHAADSEKARIAHEVTQQLNEAYATLKKHLG